MISIRSSLPIKQSAENASSGSHRLKQAAQEFEAIFLRQMLKSARSVDFGGEKLLGGEAIETFTQMRDDQFAGLASTSGAPGIASLLESRLRPALNNEAQNGI